MNPLSALPAKPETSPPPESLPNHVAVVWPAMNIDTYAALERANGTKVIKIGEHWWVQVRPFFYRSLLPTDEYDIEHVSRLKRLGVFQHAVRDGQASNSYLNAIVFADPGSYSLNSVRHSLRASIKRSMKNGLTVSSIIDETEFCEKAYPVYASFYKRTGYRFGESRAKEKNFHSWAHRIFQFPEVVVLGAFTGSDLVAIQISCLVEKMLVIKSLITSDLALKLGAPELLLHCSRMSAAGQSRIQQIYCGMLTQISSLNSYKSERGARVLCLPAFLHIPRLLLWTIKKTSPTTYSRLCGLKPE